MGNRFYLLVGGTYESPKQHKLLPLPPHASIIWRWDPIVEDTAQFTWKNQARTELAASSLRTQCQTLLCRLQRQEAIKNPAQPESLQPPTLTSQAGSPSAAEVPFLSWEVTSSYLIRREFMLSKPTQLLMAGGVTDPRGEPISAIFLNQFIF